VHYWLMPKLKRIGRDAKKLLGRRLSSDSRRGEEIALS
jgi:hypothetical protein